MGDKPCGIWSVLCSTASATQPLHSILLHVEVRSYRVDALRVMIGRSTCKFERPKSNYLRYVLDKSRLRFELRVSCMPVTILLGASEGRFTSKKSEQILPRGQARYILMYSVFLTHPGQGVAQLV